MGDGGGEETRGSAQEVAGIFCSAQILPDRHQIMYLKGKTPIKR